MLQLTYTARHSTLACLKSPLSGATPVAPPEPVRETAASVAFGALWDRGWDGRFQAAQAGVPAQVLEVDAHLGGLGFLPVHPEALFERLASRVLYSVVIHPKNLGCWKNDYSVIEMLMMCHGDCRSIVQLSRTHNDHNTLPMVLLPLPPTG